MVWHELVLLGSAVRREPLYAEAQSVARETMQRAAHNVDLLVERLEALGYHFQFPERVRVLPTSATPELLDQTEKRLGGPLPLSLRAWYELVGGVSLVGSHPELSSYYDYDQGLGYQLNCYSDPLEVVFPVYPGQSVLHLYSSVDYLSPEEAGEIDATDAMSYILEVGADEVHKAGQSGGGPYYFLLPDPTADATLYGDIRYGNFVDYLRLAFHWGGFPGIRSAGNIPHDLIRFLTRDLLPL